MNTPGATENVPDEPPEATPDSSTEGTGPSAVGGEQTPRADESGEVGAPDGPSPRQILEAVLFSADEPLSLDRLREAAGLEDGHETRVLLEDMAKEYDASGRAFALEEIAHGWQLLTRLEYAPHLARLRRRPDRARLSSAALETLAVVAYRQPVLRTDIERIRGVACGEMLRTLKERDLVRVAGRAEEPGTPLLYGTTSRFLAEFGLRSLRDLPTARDLPPPPGSRMAGAAVPATETPAPDGA
jgi:segregation and condensation protein B